MKNLKVLIPTDFSVQGEYAYLMVKNLEKKIPVEVHFLHVLNVPDTVTMDEKGIIETCGDISVDYVITQKQIAERKLNELKVQYGQDTHTHLVLGKLTTAILSFSLEQKFDLIAMGRKGAWGLKETLAGSETQMVARSSRIPVLSIMCDRSDLNIENILLVHDYSQPKVENLHLLQTLISAFQTKVHFLQISTHKSDSEKEIVFKHMDEFAKLNQVSNFEKHLLHDLDVENGVIHFNEMKQMDIVCIGTHGKGGLFHKSATEKLINHLFKPILSYHLNS